jgi:hypothetical protein
LYISASVVQPESEQILVNIARLMTFLIQEAPPPGWCPLTPSGVTTAKPLASEIFTYIATLYNAGGWSKECM